MPTSVAALVAGADLGVARSLLWPAPIDEPRPGVYVVSTAADPNASLEAAASAPAFDLVRIQEWVVGSGVTLDKQETTAEAIAERLGRWWLPDETVLYVGATEGQLGVRVAAFYRTPLGARRPHSGGYWIQTLASRSALYVHLVPTQRPLAAEQQLLREFMAQVSVASRMLLPDPSLPLPWANLEYTKKSRKQHGIGRGRA